MEDYLNAKNLKIKDKRTISKETNVDLPSLNMLDEYDNDKFL
jgi:hypothetical protein